MNAIYRMGRLLVALDEYADRLRARPPDPLLGSRTLAVGRVTGGVSPNTVPDFCRIDIDRRMIPGEVPAAVVADVDAFLKAYRGVDFPFTTHPPKLACPPLSPALSTGLVTTFGRSIDAVVGEHEVHAVPYGTDASTIAEAGIPVLVFGPGDIAQAHTKDEWIELAQIDRAAEILYRLAAG